MKYEKLDLCKYPPCPICGAELIAPYHPYGKNGSSNHYLECEDFHCGFSYEVDNAGDEKITLERNSVIIIREFMKNQNS